MKLTSYVVFVVDYVANCILVVVKAHCDSKCSNTVRYTYGLTVCIAGYLKILFVLYSYKLDDGRRLGEPEVDY